MPRKRAGSRHAGGGAFPRVFWKTNSAGASEINPSALRLRPLFRASPFVRVLLRRRNYFLPRRHSAWRPTESPAGEQVEVNVVDALASLRTRIENESVAVGHGLPLVSDLIRDGDHPKHQIVVLGDQVVDGGNVLLWNNQDVGRCDRLDIVEGDHLVIAIDLASGYLPGEDFAEKTVLGHGRSLAGTGQ